MTFQSFFFSRLDFQVQGIETIKEKVLFLEGNEDIPCLIHVPNVRGVCGCHHLQINTESPLVN